MRKFRLWLCLGVGLAGAMTAAAQTATPSPSPKVPTFAAEANLVHVDAVVTDNQGRQVSDLQASDFEIESKGRRFKAAIATYVPLVDDSDAFVGARRGAKLRAQDVRRVVAFLVARPEIVVIRGAAAAVTNMEGTMFITHRIDHMLTRFIEANVKPHDLVAFVNAETRKAVLNQFTASPESLSLALDTLRNEWNNPEMPPITLSSSLPVEPLVRYTSEVVHLAEGIVKQMQDVPGRRMLFLVFGIGGIEGPEFSSVRRELDALVEHANRAGVTIYGVGPGGTASVFPTILYTVADGTGGSVIGTERLGEVMELNRGYYLLGYDTGDAPTNLPRSVKVRVSRVGLKVAARPQAYEQRTGVANTSSTDKRELEALLNSTLAADAVPVRLTPYISWTGLKTGEFQVVVDIDPEDLDLGPRPMTEPSIELDVLTRIVDQRGNVLENERTSIRSNRLGRREAPIRFTFKAPLSAPGSYQADAAVEDKRSGQQGDARVLASLPDLSENQDTLIASSLVMRGAEPPDAPPVNTFNAGSSVLWSCRVAHAQRAGKGVDARLRVQVRILRDGRPVMELEPRVLSKEFRELIDLNGEITLADLTPGDYQAEVEITDLLGAAGRNKVRLVAEFSAG